MTAAPPQLCGGRVLSLLLVCCVIPWSLEADPWYIGCYNRSSLNFQENGYETLPAHKGDLPVCSKFCLQNNSLSLIANISGMCYVSASESSRPQIRSAAEHVKVLDAMDNVTVFIANGIDHANIVENADGSYSTRRLQFKALTHSEAKFRFDFGDGTTSLPINGSPQTTGFGASAFHRYTKAGDYIIRVLAFNDLFAATAAIGPYYVQAAPAGLSIVMGSNSVYKDDIISFSAALTGGTNVSYLWSIGDRPAHNNIGSEINVTFSSVAVYNVTVTAWNKVGMQKAWKVVSVLPRKKSIYIYTNGTVFSTEAYITFTAVTDESGPMVFSWQFDDRSPERTVRRSLIKRFTVPNRYNIKVNASNQLTSLTSDPYTIFVQRKVLPNRLVASSAVLLNSTVSFTCRINSGTNASYFWNFGDGVERLGKSNDTHVFTREGEYTVNVSVYNNVSSAALSKQIFVVKEHCQPPPVKNMGPPKIQMKRYEELHLGVTFEAAVIHCNISQGLYYRWSFVKSDGTVIPLPPHIDNQKQTVTLPAFFLDYGNYTAVARVQIVGNVVYSNYSVSVEVQRSDPVSVIASGHHFFIDKATVKYFTLNGTPSFDPDNPGAHLRFHWSCAAVSVHEHSCFDSNALNPLKDDSVVTFPTAQLNDRCRQFHFTLTVSNGERKSSAAETFLSISHNTNLRTVEVTCSECRGLAVNWNQQFSVQAVCADCGNSGDISYQWNLYWINATEISTPDVPFCRLKESMGAPSAVSENDPNNGTSSKAPTLRITSNNVDPTAGYAEKQVTEHSPHTADLPKMISDNAESSQSVPDLYMMEFSESHLDLLDEGSTGGRGILRHQSASDADLDYQGLHAYDMSGFISGDGEGENLLSNATRGQTHNDFDTHFYGNIVEGIGGSGTRTGSELDFSYDLSDEYAAPYAGDNFVDLSVAAPNVLPMVHWLKLPISNELFKSSTISGISSQTVIMRPFLLTPTKMYMLDVTLESNGSQIGRSQLYFTVNEMSHKITCQVQPRSGIELFTTFSIFCTSGREDLSYEFSYQRGESSRKTLYKGRDIQYYFNLPSGDPSRGYQVTVFTQITNLYGSQTRPCPVNVTVLPIVLHSISGNPLSQLELFQESLRNLSTLVLMGSHKEIRNYIVLLTTMVNRLNTEDRGMSLDLQSEIRNKLIFIVQGLSFSNQDDLNDILSMLRDLFTATNQVTADSAMLIINYTQSVVKERLVNTETGRYKLQKKLLEHMIWLISSAIEVHSRWPEHKTMFENGVKCMSDLMLKFITLTNERHFTVRTHFLELQTSVHPNVHNNIERISSSTFYLPKILDSQNRRENTSVKCYISQLTAFKKNPYFWAKLPSEVNGDFTSLSLFDCSAKNKFGAQDILTSVTMEIDNKNQTENFNKTQYILFRDKINFHQFSMIGKNKQSAVKITVSFFKPKTRTFPVLLLIRHSKKPSPSSFHIQLILSSEEPSAQIFLPADSLRDAEYSYMALMDADYKRHPKNKYISNMVNYTLDVRWIQCLHWSNKHWNSEDCSPQEGAPATGFTCSCAHIGTYTTASRRVSSQYNVEDVSQFVSPTKNLIPPVVVGICALIYILLMFSGKIKDQHEDPKDGFVFLQDNSPRDQQQYAVMVDVGFRSRPKTTAKVYIILHGQDGVSETRELYGPEKPLFGRNSRHIFIMSVPESLGPLWKIHIWHNNIGQSPSIYLSHVIVKDLHSGASWLFYAECWLAIDEGDGKVERELTSVGHGLGFRRLFYCKFTEYLEDFHLWGSVFSRPSYSWFSRRQRITACFVLLLGYMCLNAVLIHWEEEQFTVEIGLTGISAVSMSCGLKVTAAVYPLVVLLSLLFRFSQKQFAKDSGESRIKVVKGSQLNNTEGHQQSASAADTGCESNLTWQHLQYWAYDAWKTKYERDFSTSSAHLQNDRRRSKNRCPSVSTQGSSGFEDCSSNNGGKTGLEDFKDCEHGSCPPYSSDRSLSENSVFHGSKVLPAWCVYVAWAVSAAIIMICVTAVGAVGFRFGATRCVLWFHALFFSLIYCIFIIQPSLIFLAALFVAWQKRQRTDFFCEALSEDVKYIVGEPGLPLSRQRSHEKSNFEKILAARRRARYLRLARPPTPAQLKMAKDKLRRKTIIGKIFRELAVYIIMASMLISIIVGQSSPNEYSVNGAVRDVFTRNAKQPFTEIRTMDDWWNFGFNVLLDGLYWKKWHNEDSLKEVGPIEGKFYIIGDPLMRKLDVANDSSCAISPFSTPAFPDCTLSHLPNGAKDTNCTTKIQDCTFYQCGKIQCYEDRGPVINLGRSRTEAHSALWKTREQQWVDRRTRAVLVQFLLYNPPTNLFTAVSLLTELPASGDIITSSRIDSISIYRITAPMDYVIMMIELMYLGMVFICFYLQLNTLVQRGVRSYWQEPWNWVEAAIIGLSLGCYGCQVYHFMLTVDATDQLQRRFFKVFINFSLIAGVEKWARCLHRMLLFLMMIRFIKLLRFYKRTAPWVAVFQHSCSRSAFTMHIGVVFIMAFSSSGYLIFSSESYAFCSALSSLQTICVHLLGVRGIKHIRFLQNEIKSNHVSVACFYGALFIAFTILWTGMLKEILTSVGKYSKKAQRSKHLVTLAELASHTRRLVLSVVCGQRQKQTDGVCVTSSSYYLDEFEDLIDELLFRLNAISNGLHHSLPAKSQSYTEEEGDGQNSDSRSDLSFKQTEENAPRGERRRDSFTLQTERDFSDVLGINLSCLPQGLEGASRNGYRIPEEVLSKLKYSEDAINHDECGLPVANSKQCLEVSQQADAPQYLPRDEKAILPPVLYMHPFAHASNLKYDKADCKTCCTSANIQNKSCRPLRRSHTTVLQPLGSSATALWKKSNGHGRKASANLNNEGDSEQPHCNVFHQSFREVLNEKESTETPVETATRRFQQTPISTIIQRDDKTPSNTNASVIPCSVKQCW